MEPALPNGCRILVNEERTEFEHNAVLLLKCSETFPEGRHTYLSPVRTMLRPYKRRDLVWQLELDATNHLWAIWRYQNIEVLGRVELVITTPGTIFQARRPGGRPDPPEPMTMKIRRLSGT